MSDQEEAIRRRMAWPPVVSASISACMGAVSDVHTAMPPLSLGGKAASVAVSPQPDGSVKYTTIGVSTPDHEHPTELILHAAQPDERIVELMSLLGREVFHGRLGHRHTIPLAGPGQQVVFDAVALVECPVETPLDGKTLGFLQVIAMDHATLNRAREEGITAILTEVDKAPAGRMAVPNQA